MRFHAAAVARDTNDGSCIGLRPFLLSGIGLGSASLGDPSFSDVIIASLVRPHTTRSKMSCMVDERTFEAAMARRDPSFDGVFFVAVKSTGIYCRPVCKARMPRPENVRFYPSAAAAERAGFRPCLRCRPETAPFCPAWKGSRSTVERALRLIEEGALDSGSVDALADRLGVGARHLSRLIREHLHASPLQVAKTLRVQRAKHLLNETSIPISEIAVRAGFRSARRMTAAFRDVYGRTPSDFRRRSDRDGPSASRTSDGRVDIGRTELA